jgi:hypothetical protein
MKRGDCVCVAKSVMSGTKKCELARKAWGNSFVVDDATNQNCTAKWSDRNCTKEVHFRSTVRRFLMFLMITISYKNCDILTKLPRTCFTRDTISRSFILHMTACFVRNDRNCTTWTKNIDYRVRYVLATSMASPQVANWGDVLPKSIL